MLVLIQGTFVPAGASGFFFIWGLRAEPAAEPPRKQGLSQYPQAVPPAELFPALRGVPPLHAVTCTVRLPHKDSFRLFRVPGLALAVATAAQWLLDLEGACAGTPLRPGQSLRAWSAAAKLLVEWLGRGRFLPVLQAEAASLQAGWAPAAPEPADAQRLAALAAAMPDVCRAVVPPGRDHRRYQAPGADALLGWFLQAGVADLARLLGRGDMLPATPERHAGAVHRWLAALAGVTRSDLPADLPGLAALGQALEDWMAPAVARRGAAALRTGLRLHLPNATDHGGWDLELTLQTDADPPEIVPAAAVWAALGAELVLGASRYQHPEQRLLQDLPAMARLFPPLAELLTAAAPVRLPVDEDTVVAFLGEGAALLQEAGFPVHLPAALVRAGALRARMHLRPAAAGEGRFGLGQLVAVDWDLALGDVDVSPEELRALAAQKRPLVRHRGQWVQVDPGALAAALRLLAPQRQQMALGEALRLLPEVEGATAEGWVEDLLLRLQEPARLQRVPAPRDFRGVLRPYQERGLDWLAFLRRYGLGACLADDMGLGKTVQVTALLLHEREAGLTDRPTLLVCPVSLVGNWKRELARFAPSLRVMVHHGTGRLEAADFRPAALAHDVVITTYSLAGRDEAELAAVPWAGVVADEAQNLKNPATRHSQALRRLPADYRIALTGTPVENHLGDLWSIFQFLNPGLLGSAEEFRRTYAIPIERYRDDGAAQRLRRHIGPLILRRQKADPAVALDLPEKIENTVATSLTLEQAALYEAVVQETLARAEAARGIQRHGAVLAGLTRLKQVCNHPVLVTGDGGPLEGRSGKYDRLAEMLEEVVAEGEAALVFTQFAQFGARLRQELDQRLGCPVLFLDGSTPRLERERLIARFQAGEAPVFVLSLKAGGVGLNLTAASHVFHFDRWWNPAVEDQATDRAHRIGQSRRVLVHKLVTAGTLEERIDGVLADKRALSSQVLGTGEGWLGELSTEQLRALITLERE